MNDQKKNLLKAKVSLSLLNVLGRRPTPEEVKRYWIASQVFYTTIVGAHFEKKQARLNNQLAIF